jgi:DNA-binding NarL/FixJ family response regulator
MSTIVLVDDHPIIRRGIRMLLELQPDFQIVGETGNGFEAIQMIERLKPKLALLDLMIQGISGVEVARRLNQSSTSIAIFSVLGSEHYIIEALRAGVKGYILKESPAEEVVHALREIAAGHRYLSPSILNSTVDLFLKFSAAGPADQLQSLTSREREVLYLSAQGKTGTEIAGQLFVSRRTVEAQRASMMRKLGLKNQHELISFAFQKGILAPEYTV